LSYIKISILVNYIRGERGTGRGYKWDFKEKDYIKLDN
jgi:hypothetical protein